MTFKPFVKDSSETGDLFLRDNIMYRVVGYITEPAVILENVGDRSQHSVIIGAPIASEYRRLDEKTAAI